MDPALYRIVSAIGRKAGLSVPRPETDINSTEWVRFFTRLAQYVEA